MADLLHSQPSVWKPIAFCLPGNYGLCGLYVALSVVGCIAGVWCGKKLRDFYLFLLYNQNMSLSVYEETQLIKTFSHEIGHFLVMQQTVAEFHSMVFEDCSNVREYENAITEFGLNPNCAENLYALCKISIAGVIAEYLYKSDLINYEDVMTNFENIQFIDKTIFDENLNSYLRLTTRQENTRQLKEEIFNSVLTFLKEKREKIQHFTDNMIQTVITYDNGINFPKIELIDISEIYSLMD